MPTSNVQLDRIRKLLAKAEDSGVTPAEAEALTGKAADRVVTISNPWAAVRAHMLCGIGSAMRCQCLLLSAPTGARVHVFGYGSDIERAEVLYTSVLIQMSHGLAQAVIPGWTSSPRAWRRSWLLGYATAVIARVRAAERRAATDAQTAQPAGDSGQSTALVLASRQQVIARRAKAAYPTTRKGQGDVFGQRLPRRLRPGQPRRHRHHPPDQAGQSQPPLTETAPRRSRRHANDRHLHLRHHQHRGLWPRLRPHRRPVLLLQLGAHALHLQRPGTRQPRPALLSGSSQRRRGQCPAAPKPCKCRRSRGLARPDGLTLDGRRSPSAWWPLAERMPDLPLVAERVSDPGQAPAVLTGCLGGGGSACGDCLGPPRRDRPAGPAGCRPFPRPRSYAAGHPRTAPRIQSERASVVITDILTTCTMRSL